MHAILRPHVPLPPAVPGHYQRASRSQVEHQLGWLREGDTIHEGHHAVRLQALGPGGLYLTRGGVLAAIRPAGSAEQLEVCRFEGPAAHAWAEVHARLPEVRLGVTLPRFWLHADRSGLRFGVLDLASLQDHLPQRDRASTAAAVARANADPAAFARELSRARVADRRWELAREAGRWALPEVG